MDNIIPTVNIVLLLSLNVFPIILIGEINEEWINVSNFLSSTVQLQLDHALVHF